MIIHVNTEVLNTKIVILSGRQTQPVVACNPVVVNKFIISTRI